MQISSMFFVSLLACIFIVIAAFIQVAQVVLKRRGLRNLSHQAMGTALAESSLLKKYDNVDIKSYRSTYSLLGAFLAVATSLLAVSWTVYVKPPLTLPQNFTDYPTVKVMTEADLPIPPPQKVLPPFVPPPTITSIKIDDKAVEQEPPKEINQSPPNETPVNYVKTDPSAVAQPLAQKAIAPPVMVVPIKDEGPVLPFITVTQMPRFKSEECEDLENLSPDEIKKCAEKKMLEFVYKNIKYPPVARDAGIEGTAVVKFIVNEKGEIISPEILKNPGGGLGEEALRIIKLFPSWVPGRQQDKNVPVYFNMPVRFQLSQN
jgi:protein TonB